MSRLPQHPRADWLISPAFDLLFFANVPWLLIAMPAFLLCGDTLDIEYWQIHFITTPHRWITLLLVATDSDRRAGRTGWFLLIAAVALMAIAIAQASSETFICLVLINHLWNAWHFASQHSGILRIYSRKSGVGRRWLEVWAMRTFIVYAMLRPLPWVFGWIEGYVVGGASYQWILDCAMLTVPAVMLAVELSDRPQRRPAKLAYLSSVCLLYGGLLAAAALTSAEVADLSRWILGLGFGATLFHSVEYFAIITPYARRRQHSGTPGVFQQLARHWIGVMAGFMICLGLFTKVLSDEYVGATVRELWIGVNLWVSTLHFAYDGMIWKLRRPETAKALEAQMPAGEAVGAKE